VKAVECVKLGMADYVLKDRLARLPMAVRRAVYEWRLRHEREQAQEALRRSEASYRSLVKRSQYGIFRARLEDCRFLEVNRALVQMLGYRSEADLLESDPAAEVYLDGGAILEKIRDRAHHGRPWSTEIAWRRKGGSLITVELTGGAVADHQGEPCLELIANDITARKLAEARIRQLNRLYAVSTHVSQAVVRFRSVTELLQEVYRIMVEEGHFRMAWVALTDTENTGGQARRAVGRGWGLPVADSSLGSRRCGGPGSRRERHQAGRASRLQEYPERSGIRALARGSRTV
jgi:PAS domain S-box-containing protein